MRAHADRSGTIRNPFRSCRFIGAGAVADGTTVVTSDDNTSYGPDANSFNSGTLRSLDAFISNVVLPASETYFLKVEGTGADTTGNYELFVAAPEPASWAGALIGLAGITLWRPRVRGRRGAMGRGRWRG